MALFMPNNSVKKKKKTLSCMFGCISMENVSMKKILQIKKKSHKIIG